MLARFGDVFQGRTRQAAQTPANKKVHPRKSQRNLNAYIKECRTMEPRLDYTKASPEAYKAMAQLEAVVRHSGLDAKLLELVKIRASQLNGCAFCIDMHTKDARAKDETEQRIYALDAWRETSFFSEKERAALGWRRLPISSRVTRRKRCIGNWADISVRRKE